MRHKLKIRTYILFLLILVILSISVTYSVHSYLILKDETMKLIDAELSEGALKAVDLVPDEYYLKITGKDSISRDEYFSVVEKLTKYAKLHGYAYIYTFMIKEGKIIYLANSVTEADLKNNAWYYYYSEEPLPPDLQEKYHKLALQKEQPLINFETAGNNIKNPSPANKTKKLLGNINQFVFWAKVKRLVTDQVNLVDNYKTKDGDFRSATIPFKDSQGRQYFAGADYYLHDIKASLRKLIINCIIIGLIILIPFVYVTIVIAGKIANPVMQLVECADSLQKNAFSFPEKTKQRLKMICDGRQKEIGDLACTFMAMDKTLNQYKEELKQEVAAQERISSELEISRNIQMGFLHKNFPAFPQKKEFDLYSRVLPAKQIGGDLYDFQLIDDDHLFLCVGDVSDKSVPAALFMSVTQTLIRSALKNISDPAQVLQSVNANLYKNNDNLMFVTVFCALLSLKTGELIFSNAGHNPPVLIPKSSDPKLVDLPKGLVLGVDPDAQFQNKSLRLNIGDGLLVYTDGVTEAKDVRRQLYSESRLLEISHTFNQKTPQQIVESLIDSVNQFAHGTTQFDDITVLSLTYSGT
ncbi:MAG: PP2C family protein-serine/threonine phosphatase [Candidatus Schekmanbacteria bacterium]|nr:PP2C family protein-serine/threonine phosphatase [Candidatus Schekmanbacteria bacterium]